MLRDRLFTTNNSMTNYYTAVLIKEVTIIKKAVVWNNDTIPLKIRKQLTFKIITLFLKLFPFNNSIKTQILIVI